MKFCQAISKPPLPATEKILVLFVAHLSKSVCHSTVRAYLSAVRYLHLSKGLPDPLSNTVQLELVLKGIKRKNPAKQDKRLPITPMTLENIWKVILRAPTEYTNFLMWAACCLGYFAFLRGGEFTVNGPFDPQMHLEVGDVAVDDYQAPTMLSIFLKQSKTDQEKAGVRLFVGRTHQVICPVTVVLSYMAVRQKSATMALFVLEDGSPLSRVKLVEWLKATLRTAGIDASFFSGHSFRIGAASTAAAKGLGESTIQTLGRWKSDSYKRYIRIPRQELAAVSAVITN